MGWLFAMTLPGLVFLLVAVAALERFGLWLSGRSWVPWRRGREGTPVSAAGFEEFAGALSPGKRIELDHRRMSLAMRDEQGDGAPPRGGVDLDRGIAWISPSPGTELTGSALCRRADNAVQKVPMDPAPGEVQTPRKGTRRDRRRNP